jgi:hypothetical protein
LLLARLTFGHAGEDLRGTDGFGKRQWWVIFGRIDLFARRCASWNDRKKEEAVAGFRMRVKFYFEAK